VIPLGDSLGSRRQPLVSVALIGACVLVFAYELTLRGAALDRFVAQWGAVPQQVLGVLADDPGVPRAELLTLFTSQFIHAGFLHLGGNLLFLWVFGRAVEDRLGHAVFLGFYLLAGAIAGLVQSFVSGPSETLPLVGASGAIAAVLGMYFVSYPRAWVRVLLPVLFFFWAFDLPALLVLGFWFASQFFVGMAAITQASHATGGVAIWAHVSGFAIGAACGFMLSRSGPATLPRTVGSATMRRGDAPGPARLISSIADLLALLLGARLVLRLFGSAVSNSPVGGFALPVVGVTQPVVEPMEHLLPTVRVAGGVLEVATLVAIVCVYLVAGLVGQAFVKSR
jgi:membrane associated rhomboid family serine protease/uncharacterized protein YggT (Ycf19 family)